MWTVVLAFLAWLLTAVLKGSIFRYIQQTSCITRDHSRVSREKFPATRAKIPAWSLRVPRKIHASSEALLRGKIEIFTQDTWKLDLSRRWYCIQGNANPVSRQMLIVFIKGCLQIHTDGHITTHWHNETWHIKIKNITAPGQSKITYLLDRFSNGHWALYTHFLFIFYQHFHRTVNNELLLHEIQLIN